MRAKNTRTFSLLDGSFILLLVGLTVTFFQVIAPFVLTLFVAAVLSAMLYRPYVWLDNHVPGPRAISAVVTVVSAIAIVAVPVLLVGLMVYIEAVGGYTYITENWPELADRLEEVRILTWLQSLPYVGEMLADIDLGEFQLNELFRNILSASSEFLVSATQRSFANIANAMLNLFILVVLVFFFLLDGPRLVERIKSVTPLSSSETDRIVSSARNIISSTLLTTFGLGFIEGAFGTLLFALFGLPSPFLWGLIMVIFSIIPMIGANGILTPAGLILLFTGSPERGIALIALATAITFVTQNLIRPAILGERGGMHPALVLLSTLGGLAWLGLVGFLIGPLVAALFVVIWTEFSIRFRHALAGRDSFGDDDEGDSPLGYSRFRRRDGRAYYSPEAAAGRSGRSRRGIKDKGTRQ